MPTGCGICWENCSYLEKLKQRRGFTCEKRIRDARTQGGEPCCSMENFNLSGLHAWEFSLPFSVRQIWGASFSTFMTWQGSLQNKANDEAESQSLGYLCF
jgi:hypothetical protein